MFFSCISYLWTHVVAALWLADSWHQQTDVPNEVDSGLVWPYGGKQVCVCVCVCALVLFRDVELIRRVAAVCVPPSARVSGIWRGAVSENVERDSSGWDVSSPSSAVYHCNTHTHTHTHINVAVCRVNESQMFGSEELRSKLSRCQLCDSTNGISCALEMFIFNIAAPDGD